ncbi:MULTISPECIES: TolC family outer membrane protein [unclassified Devosia]|uniref:TolC family outer membrane protein n=1 Tax=unclassified Devosia TaxID=196773 RepID=UPI00145E38D5|nr:TolC family outer membrane protein [Devosia sp. MC521]MBJ6987928.1 TolC family outer membrane protein [Devosia sp. MC521]QMW62008.1 TolC family outer membrane protein [Devosia sp. MC521]
MSIKIMNSLLKSALLAGIAFVMPLSAQAMGLREAVQTALDSNPQIGAAIQNHDAIGFELRQAEGLWAPRVDLEASTGIQYLNTPSRRATGIENDALYPSQVGVTARWDLYDGGFRDAELARQAARVDSASYRVLERSEFIALQIARVYYQVLLQQQIVNLTRQNASFHEGVASDVSSAIENGQLTEADRLQSIERLAAARARVTEAGVELAAAQIEYKTLVGLMPGAVNAPPRASSGIPGSLEIAVANAIVNNPRVKTAGADINAASALVEQAASDFMPKIQLEGRAATGYDVSGAHEWQNDLSARVSLRWNIYDGGIARNHVQEEMRRENEAKMVFDQTAREVEQAVRESWLRMKSQAELSRVYNEQLNSSSGLVDSYREQFTIGERSLLDLLDSQNTRFNVQILQETARYSVMFAEYRVLAASGTLIDFLGVQTHDAASAGTFSAFDLKSWEQFEPRTLEPLNLQKVGNY